MEITGDFLFDAPQELVWKALQDPNVLGSVLPGGQGISATGENEYQGTLQIKVGPVQGTFQGKIKLLNIQPPHSYQIEVDGKGTQGYVKANGGVQLEDRGQQTFMSYSGQATIGGRIASVGQRLIDASARSIIRQSLEGLNEYLKLQVPAVSPPESVNDAAPTIATTDTLAPLVSMYKPPSQSQLAMNVARDVLSDLVPAPYRPVVIIALVVIALWLIRRLR